MFIFWYSITRFTAGIFTPTWSTWRYSFLKIIEKCVENKLDVDCKDWTRISGLMAYHPVSSLPGSTSFFAEYVLSFLLTNLTRGRKDILLRSSCNSTYCIVESLVCILTHEREWNADWKQHWKQDQWLWNKLPRKKGQEKNIKYWVQFERIFFSFFTLFFDSLDFLANGKRSTW